MAYYDFYRNGPNWGTGDFQLTAPPAPTFQPQPTWGGLDYFQAYAQQSDPYVNTRLQ